MHSSGQSTATNPPSKGQLSNQFSRRQMGDGDPSFKNPTTFVTEIRDKLYDPQNYSLFVVVVNGSSD